MSLENDILRARPITRTAPDNPFNEQGDNDNAHVPIAGKSPIWVAVLLLVVATCIALFALGTILWH